MKKLLLIALILQLTACGQSGNQKPAEPVSEVATTAEDATEQPKEQSVPKIEFLSLEDAIAKTKPEMKDFNDIEISKGAAVFAYWASEHLKWADLQKTEGSKHALVMKDPDTERGKKLCTNASIVEIQVDNTMPNKVKIYTGGLFDSSMRIYRFIAVGSTGELVANSNAKFCGIITGKNDYTNSAGGVGHAVHLVGMFDLPENK